MGVRKPESVIGEDDCGACAPNHPARCAGDAGFGSAATRGVRSSATEVTTASMPPGSVLPAQILSMPNEFDVGVVGPNVVELPEWLGAMFSHFQHLASQPVRDGFRFVSTAGHQLEQ
jgi:hypothetical protein